MRVGDRSSGQPGSVKSILAAVDFSEISEAIVDQAALIAGGFGAKLWLVHVAAPDPYFVGYEPGPSGVRDQVAAHLREEHRVLQGYAASCRERGLDATALFIQGATAETILAEAEKHEADLIVLGSHGHGALYRALLGSVGEQIVRTSTRPLLVVPARPSS
jgi:nucleotide-binding universal stress UspA family protein